MGNVKKDERVIFAFSFDEADKIADRHLKGREDLFDNIKIE
jgi:hypothetical protein